MGRYFVNLKTAYGMLHSALDVPTGDISLAQFTRAVLPVGQQLVDLMETAYMNAGRPASCAKGCAACCRQEIPISAPEALVLAEYAASMPDGDRMRVSAGFAAIREHVRATGTGGQDLPGGTAAADVRAQGLAWFKQGLACPFLKDEACTAYASRPFPCRNHIVYSPAAHCSDPGAGGVKAMNTRFSLSTIMALLAAEFMQAEPLKLPLAGLEDWLRLNPEYGERRFPSAELANRFLALLEDFCRRSFPAPKAAASATTAPVAAAAKSAVTPSA